MQPSCLNSSDTINRLTEASVALALYHDYHINDILRSLFLHLVISCYSKQCYFEYLPMKFHQVILPLNLLIKLAAVQAKLNHPKLTCSILSVHYAKNLCPADHSGQLTFYTSCIHLQLEYALYASDRKRKCQIYYTWPSN